MRLRPRVGFTGKVDDFLDSLPLHRYIRYPLRGIKDVWWWTIHRVIPRYKYHLINTGLKPNYWDIDTRMLHGCMALLCHYVEIEENGEPRFTIYIDELKEEFVSPLLEDWQRPRIEDINDYVEALTIYRWWKYDRNPEWSEAEASYDKDHDIHAYHEKERALWAKDEEMLLRLVKIRTRLWT